MQNPPDQSQNPYRQPEGGPAHPHQYPQPGSLYQPPPFPSYPAAPGGAPRTPPRPRGGGRRRTAVIVGIGAVAAAAVTATAVVLIHRGKDRPPASAPASPTASAPSASGTPARPGTSKPLVAGWKTVVNPAHGTAFDVPPGWEVLSPEMFSGYTDRKDPDKVLIGHTAPAFYKSKWCSIDGDGDGVVNDFALASVGTKGAADAKDPADVAVKTAPTWVYAAYTQPDKSVVKWDKPVEYTTKSGVKGTYVKAHSEGAAQPNRCRGDGRSVVFGFKNSKGGLVAWEFYGRTGVPGAVGDDVVMRILSTVRLAGDPEPPKPLP